MKISKLVGLLTLAASASLAHADSTTLNGSGSTFQKGYQETAIDAYGKTAGVKINYGGGGSGKGRQDDGQKFLKGLVFAPLPRSLRDKAMKQLDKIAVN